MDFTSAKTAYQQTGFFSKIILDYLKQVEQLELFYSHAVSVDGVRSAIEERKKYPVNRKLLVEELRKNYKDLDGNEIAGRNIELLLSEDTFTITTAHQPNIFTGHLYFIYKILHAIKLADHLKAELPGYNFIPVYYMGSEDADLAELGHIYINGIKHAWETEQTGAVGRMKVDKGLVNMLGEIAGEITIQPYGSEIIDKMKACYAEGATIEQATFKFVNLLFGEYGLVVLLPDNPSLKKAFIPVVERELMEEFSHKAVAETVSAFPKEYKVQSSGRDLNLFYLKDNSRERIEKTNDKWSIVNSELKFTKDAILKELNEYPERFSPNVILRPVFQELILPNVAFIGGGGEIAYWLELKKVFETVHVPFPVLVLRNSFMISDTGNNAAIKKLGFSPMGLFKSEEELLVELVKRDTTLKLSLENEKAIIAEFYANLRNIAGAVDVTLQQHTDALAKKALNRIEALERKMLRAEKKKFEAQQRQLHKIKSRLFPHNNLQERIENLLPFYARWGNVFIRTVLENSLAFEQEFIILEEG